jgi:hypothetical protein
MSCFAMFVLYPWINGVSLIGVRAGEASAAAIAHVIQRSRASSPCAPQALLWLFLPAAVHGPSPFRRAWIPLLVFPSFALRAGHGQRHGTPIRTLFPLSRSGLCRPPVRHDLSSPPDTLPAQRLVASHQTRFHRLGRHRPLWPPPSLTHAERGLILEGDAEQPRLRQFPSAVPCR